MLYRYVDNLYGTQVTTNKRNNQKKQVKEKFRNMANRKDKNGQVLIAAGLAGIQIVYLGI